jgi:hypothetical protein
MILGFSNFLRAATPYYYVDLPSFQRDFAALKTLDHGTGPAITFTRASGATFFDANGVLQTATNDAPRFDHDPVTGESRGLLIEESRTNSIRNSQAGGAVVGASGTLPTNWITNLLTGISREVVATGTVNGFSYIDIKFSGTNTSGAGGFLQIHPEALGQVVAASGQSWSASIYIALIAGTFSGTTSPLWRMVERDAATTAISGAVSTTDISAANATLSRVSVSRTLNGAGTERITSQFIWTVANGATVDFTLRIAAPQLEQGAFPTSYIPTTTAAATRAADSAVVTPISSFYNQAEGTLFAEANIPSSPSNAFAADVYTDVQNRLGIYRVASSTDMASFVMVGNSGQSGLVNTVTTQPTKSALAFASDNFAMATNGGTVAVDTSGSLPSATSLRIGQRADGGQAANGHIRKIAYWPKRLSNALLQQLTT